MAVSKVPEGAKKKPRGGSRKGRPNKATKAIKEMIEGALSAVGGQKYLEQQAIENPAAFMTLIGKILPRDINANVSGTLKLEDLVAGAQDGKR